MNSRLIGAAGESYAAKYYRDNGYQLLTANYRTRLGEIDIIVQKKNIIAFVEVKARTAGSIAKPREFVNKAKQLRIIAAANSFIAVNNIVNETLRFDVVEVYIGEMGEYEINCIENAFSL